MVGQASIVERQVVATPRKQAVGIDEVAWEASSNEGSDLDLDVKSEECAPSLSTMEDSATPQAYKRHLLVSHLQEENTRLQKALEESQFEVQRLQQDAKREKMSGLDLAHILSLARDLNLDFDGGADCVQSKSNDEAEVFAIHSPRGEGPKESHSEEGGDDAAQLRQDLEDARTEIAELHVRYAARDAALQSKFKALMAAVCGDVSGVDALQESDEEDISA